MSPHFHVNRQYEKELFRTLLQRREDKCILLIEAPAGLGKTLLMLEYGRIAREEDVRCAVLDLKYTGVVVSEVLATICEEWAECPFEEFRSVVQSFQRPSTEVEVRGVVQIGRPHIQVAVNAPDETTRREQRRQLTAALISDINSWLGNDEQGVLLIDTYDPNLITPGLKQWLGGVLLPHIKRTSGLRAVVAGRAAPEASAMWEEYCHRLLLKRLTNPEDWMEYIEAEGIDASFNEVSDCCYLHKGHPLTVATCLSSLQSREENL